MSYTGRDVHLDKPLSNVAIAYRPEGFIADMIAPIVPVPKQSDAYYVWSSADAFRTENDHRAPGTEANVMERSVSSGTFFADNYALKMRTPYEDLKNADAAQIFLSRQSRAEAVKDKLMLNMEYRVGQQCTSGSNVGSYSTVASAWTTLTNGNSDPIGNINTAIENVQDATGVRPNSIIMGNYAWRLLRQHADATERIFGSLANTGGRTVLQSHIKELFEMERFMVGGAYYNSADEGQSQSLSQIWNDNVLVYYAPMTPRFDKPSFMYSFRWNGVPGFNMQAEVFQLPRAKAEEVQLGYYQDEKITATGLGFLITGVGSSQ